MYKWHKLTLYPTCRSTTINNRLFMLCFWAKHLNTKAPSSVGEEVLWFKVILLKTQQFKTACLPKAEKKTKLKTFLLPALNGLCAEMPFHKSLCCWSIQKLTICYWGSCKFSCGLLWKVTHESTITQRSCFPHHDTGGHCATQTNASTHLCT